MSWFERQLGRIQNEPRTCIIDAPPACGAPYLFHAWATSSDNVVWIELEEGDDAVAIGNRLSNGLLRTTGATFFGMGMPYQYGLGYLQRLTDELGPLTLLVTNGHEYPEFVSAALRRAAIVDDAALRVVVSGCSSASGWTSLLGDHGALRLCERDLKVTLPEVKELFTHSKVEDEALEHAWRLCGGAYEGLITSVTAIIGGRPPARPSPDGIPTRPGDAQNDVGLLERLMAAERWQEAFEHAVRTRDELAFGLINDAADSYFSNGDAQRFLHFLRRLGSASSNPLVAYWEFSAGVSLGRVNEAEDRAARYLEFHEAPELQAAFASSIRPPNALALAEASVAQKRSPETLTSLGFLRVMHGDADVGIPLLKEAFEGFKAARRYHKAVQVSNLIGTGYGQAGDFRRGMYWARWSLDELRRRGIREELLRLSSINLLAYTYLLVGETDAGEELLRQISLDVEGPLPSTLEGLISTFGDYAVVLGRSDEALRRYERLLEHFGSRLPGYAAHNYVRGLVHAGRVDDAHAALQVAEEVASPADDIEQVNLGIARILVDAFRTSPDSQRFSNLMSNPVVEADAVLRAELVICYSAHLAHEGNTRTARDVLREHHAILEDLGTPAWRLFAPPIIEIDYLRGLLVLNVRRAFRLSMLGARSLLRDGEELAVSPRFAELLVVLALHPEGLAGESLLYEVYGERGRVSTLKATISRTRKLVDIDSIPYRLSDPFAADFVELEDDLRKGRLREALELYKGPLLPESDAPGVRRARERIDEAVRQAVLHAGEWDLALRLARRFPDDLELWEEAGRLAPKNDPAYPLIRAQVRRIRGEWGL